EIIMARVQATRFRVFRIQTFVMKARTILRVYDPWCQSNGLSRRVLACGLRRLPGGGMQGVRLIGEVK
ncbi:hypothetical protein KBA39_08005, partial [Myxococcota bacterium]|nr:hypothetical protein [Myxococcota bacterium]